MTILRQRWRLFYSLGIPDIALFFQVFEELPQFGANTALP